MSRYGYGAPVPFRFSNEAYVAKLLFPVRSVADTIKGMSFYSAPARKFTGMTTRRVAHTQTPSSQNTLMFQAESF